MNLREAYAGKRVLVTGHTGFKGGWLTTYLHHLGAELYGISNRSIKGSLVEKNGILTRIEDFFLDIRDAATFNASFKRIKPDFVFHLAAQALVSDSVSDPVTTFTTNVAGTLNVLEAVRQAQWPIVIVLVTSDKCYENMEWTYGYRETDRLGGKDPYSASKACAEIAYSSFFRTYFNSQKNIRIVSARAGNVIGGGDWSRARIIPDAVSAWQAGGICRIRNPYATRPWQHVLEPVHGYLRLGAELYKSDAWSGGSYNIGPSTVDFEKNVLALIKRASIEWGNADYDYDASSGSSVEANLLTLDCTKIRKDFGLVNRLTFDQTVSWTIDWYKAYFESPASIAELTFHQIQTYEKKCDLN
jgi:CDP-glucose 4,6-dehydratase